MRPAIIAQKIEIPRAIQLHQPARFQYSSEICSSLGWAVINNLPPAKSREFGYRIL